MKKAFLAIILCTVAHLSMAQVPVILAPIPVFLSFLNNGQPNAFGCVFTYASQTTTPIPSWVDFSGTVMNENPVNLNASGAASIWIQAGISYKLVIKSSGGVNCSSGSTDSTVNGIGGGASIQTTNVAWSSTPQFTVTAQNQLFTITLADNTAALPLSVIGITPPSTITFQITQDGSGGHTFTWPSNVNGGATVYPQANSTTTQQFVWNGTIASAVGPAVVSPNSIGSQPFLETGSIISSGSLTTASSITASAGISSSTAIAAPVINATSGYQIGGSFGTAGQVPMSTGTGTTFITPAVTASYTQNGTFQSSLKIVTGAVVLSGGTATMTLLGSAIFTTSYLCWANDITAPNAASAVVATFSTVTVTGTTTDHIQVICLGN